MLKTMFALSLAGLATVAAAQTPAPAPAPAPVAPAPAAVAPAAPTKAPALTVVPINAPAEIVADTSNQLTLELSNGGRVLIQMRPDAAPQMVQRIKTLVNSGFYNGLTFHRVIPDFMAQGGDPQGDGSGGSQLPDVPAEFNSLPHLRGSVAAARAEDPNSANSQFYIMFVPRVSLNGKYTVFGRVIQGMPFVDQISQGEPPAEPTRIVRASLGGAGQPSAEVPTPGRPGTADQLPEAQPQPDELAPQPQR
jgi:cyclophilin family peptidyl-prolyl cis-trans isomerase